MVRRRYKVIFFVYTMFFVLWVFFALINANREDTSQNTLVTRNDLPSNYWFMVYYNNRYWLVNKNGKIYDVYQDYTDSQLITSPFVSGINVNYETGELDKKALALIPKDIPKIIFEINLNEKYITTTKSAIIYLTDVDDIIACSSILRTVGEYLDSGKIFLFKNGKLYLL